MQQLYKGDVEPKQAFDMLKAEQEAVLVDVRTDAEWKFVGYADLSQISKKCIFLDWRVYPTMSFNSNFISELMAKVPNKNCSILFLCRTGGRSQEAAIEMTKYGYENCYNILDGFEGSANPKGHRGEVSGWKFDKLPWRQD